MPILQRSLHVALLFVQLYLATLYRFNVKNGEWEKIVTSIAPGPRSSHQTFWGPDGKLYLFGGTVKFDVLVIDNYM